MDPVQLTSPSETPPQKTKPLIYALYALPVLSLLLSLYLFALRPCLYRRRSIRAALAPAPGGGMQGLSVIPLMQGQQHKGPSSGGGCCGRRGGKPPPGFSKQEWALRQRMMGGAAGMGGSPTVNLLVDAAPFAEHLRQSRGTPSDPAKDKEKRRRAREKRKRRAQIEARRSAQEAAGQVGYGDEEEGTAWGSDTSSSSEEDSEDDEDLPTARERQIAMHKWSLARAWAKKMVAVDVLGGVLWVAVVGAAIYLNGVCPVGGYDVWWSVPLRSYSIIQDESMEADECGGSARSNYYNLGLAMACLSAVASWISAGLGVVDLGRCRVPPLGVNELGNSRGGVPWA